MIHAYDNLPDLLLEHVRQHAVVYFPELDGESIRVHTGRVSRGQFAERYVLTVETTSPHPSPLQRRILAKAVLRPDQMTLKSCDASDAMTRMTPSPDLPGQEYAAMADFEKHVAQRGDRRLFPVRVLDSILDDHVLLLEHVDAKPLSQMLLGASRARGGRVTASLSETMHRAGVLLRNFHEQPSSPNRQARGTTKDDFLAWIDMAGRLASQHPYGERVFQAHGPRLMELADQLLPTDLPIAPIHDDFAPRNVLVDPSQRVGIIDALEQWQGCPWEDLGHFLFSLSANKFQAMTFGRFFPSDALREIRNAFIAGYYESARAPTRQLLLYEAQVTLTKLAAQWYQVRTVTGWGKAAQRARLAVSMRWFARHIGDCLAQLASITEDDGVVEFEGSTQLAGGVR